MDCESLKDADAIRFQKFQQWKQGWHPRDEERGWGERSDWLVFCILLTITLTFQVNAYLRVFAFAVLFS